MVLNCWEIQIEPVPGVVLVLPLVIGAAPQSGVRLTVLLTAKVADFRHAIWHVESHAKSLQYGCAISIQIVILLHIRYIQDWRLSVLLCLTFTALLAAYQKGHSSEGCLSFSDLFLLPQQGDTLRMVAYLLSIGILLHIRHTQRLKIVCVLYVLYLLPYRLHIRKAQQWGVSFLFLIVLPCCFLGIHSRVLLAARLQGDRALGTPRLFNLKIASYLRPV